MRKYPKLKDYTPQQFAQAAKSLLDLNAAKAKTNSKLRDVYGVVVENAFAYFDVGFETFFTYLRDIKGVSVDLRRRPEKIYAACDMLSEMNYCGFESQLIGETALDTSHEPYDAVIGFLAHTVMNQKQFDRLYAPYMRKVLDLCESMKKNVLFYSEGSFLRFANFLNDYKKGTIAVQIETDDPYQFRKACPNACIFGGLNVDTMGHGTTKECVDMAKHAIETLGSNGGLVLMPNKMISFAYDMKADNLKAVCDYVAESKL